MDITNFRKSFTYSVCSFLLATLLISCSQSSKAPNADNKILVADAHNDVLSGTVLKGYDISLRLEEGNTDLVRLKEGGVDLQIFAAFGNDSYSGKKGFDYVNRQIDSLYALQSRNKAQLGIAHTIKQAKDFIKEGKIAGMIGLEGGHLIDNQLDNLDSLRKRGVVYMTLTWNNSNAIASSSVDENNPDKKITAGLTEFGKQVIARMNHLGIAVDLSHVGEKAFYEATKASTLPVLASHSNTKALCNVPRNLTDDQIKAIARTNGVVCVTFYAPFLDDKYYERVENAMKENTRIVDSLKNKGYQTKDQLIAAFLTEKPQLAEELSVPIGKLVDHIDHIVKIAGINHVGIGSDYFGQSTSPFPKGLNNVSGYSLLIQALKDRGYSDKEVRKIAGENLLRVLEENIKAKNNNLKK